MCPECKSKEVIRRGHYRTKINGKVQRFFCKSCKKKFISRTPFYRMRSNPQKITLCLDLYYRGISTREIQQHLSAFYPHNASWVSIYKWIIKYSDLISKFTDKLKLKVGKEIQVDEMEYKTKGKPSWFIDSIDTKTRYMVSSEFTKERSKWEIEKVLRAIKKRTKKQVEIITTDGFLAYVNVVKSVYGYNLRDKKTNIFHNQVNASKGEGFNLMIERLHNNIRARTKTMRGFKNINSANAIMKGYAIYYNFIKKHQSLNKTPSELATNLKLKEPNKWLELIKMSF